MFNDVDGEAVAETVDAIKGKGGRAIDSTESVASAAGAAAIVEAVQQVFGKVTILVNNAGIIQYAPFVEITDDGWRRMMAVTLDGTFFMTRAVWPAFLALGHGRVINTTGAVSLTQTALHTMQVWL